MKINKTTGSIELGQSDVQIGPSLTKRVFLSSSLGVLSKLDVANKSFETYSFTFTDGGDDFVVSLGFNDQRINVVWFAKKCEGTSWADWSEAEELRLRTQHDHLLETMLGKPPYKFRWGEITSSYDPRSGGSHITIRYRT